MKYPFVVQDVTNQHTGLAVKRGARTDSVVAYMDYMAELKVHELLEWRVADACYGTPAQFVARMLKQQKQGMKIPESAVARLSAYAPAELAAGSPPNRAQLLELEMARAKKTTVAAEGAAAPAKKATGKKAAPAAKKAVGKKKAPWGGAAEGAAPAAKGAKGRPASDQLFTVAEPDRVRRGTTGEHTAIAVKMGQFTREAYIAKIESKVGLEEARSVWADAKRREIFVPV